MSPTSRVGRPAGLLAAAVVMVALLAGCGAGQTAVTTTESAVIDGVNGSVGALSLRYVYLQSEPGYDVAHPGGNARAYLYVINEGPPGADDTFLGATTDAARSVTIVPEQSGAPSPSATSSVFPSATPPSATPPSATPPSATPAPGAPSPSPSGPTAVPLPGASSVLPLPPAVPVPPANPTAVPLAPPPASPSAAASVLPTSPTVASLVVPGNGQLAITPGHYHLLLRDLTRPLRSGQSIQITFTFAHAGRVTLPVPVQTPGAPPPVEPASPTPTDQPREVIPANG